MALLLTLTPLPASLPTGHGLSLHPPPIADDVKADVQHADECRRSCAGSDVQHERRVDGEEEELKSALPTGYAHLWYGAPRAHLFSFGFHSVPLPQPALDRSGIAYHQ